MTLPATGRDSAGDIRELAVSTAGVLATSNNGYSSKVTAVRPANATAYAAGDVVGATAAMLTFTDIGPANGSIVITDSDLRIDVSSVPAGMTSFRLHLYNEPPASAFADNAVWDLPAGDGDSYLGYIDLGSPVDVGSTLFVQSNGTGTKQVKMGTTTNLYGYRVTNSAYTPTASASMTLRLYAKGV